MKSWTKFVAALVVAGLVSTGFAADDKAAADKAAQKAAKAAERAANPEKKPKVKAVKGRLVKVDGSNLVLNVAKKGEEAKEVTIATDANTKVTIDGKEAKLSDIPAGVMVGAMPDTGVAQQIIVQTPKPKQKKEQAAPAVEKAK